MTIRNGHGSTSVRVEEYKRPKFNTEIEPLEGEYQLNDSVKVTGSATAFAGNKIDGASVAYRVTRTTRYNYYRWNWYWGGNQNTEKEIDFGTTTTDENGEYNIVFKAIADKTKDLKTLPVFDYKIYADVTDINGETHSTMSVVSVGYQSLVLGNNLPNELSNKNDLIVRVVTNNLNGQKINAVGQVKIYPLITPNVTYKNRLWKTPDIQAWTEREFKTQFPGEVYKDEDDFHNWKKGKSLFNEKFNTSNTDSVNVKNFKKWSTGMYVYESVAFDKNGFEIKDVKYFSVFNNDDIKPATNEVFKVKGLKTNVYPGDDAKFLIATAEKDLNVFYTIEHQGKIVHQEWLNLSNEQKQVSINVEEKHRGNFSVNFSVIKNSRSFNETQIITVPYENKRLDLAFSTFRNKLLPGQDEEWTLTIKNAKGEKEMAEMLATLYDASLDELYTPNSFFMSIYRSYYSSNNWSNHAGIGQRIVSNNNYYWNNRISVNSRLYPYLNHFGYSAYYYGRQYNYFKSEGATVTNNASYSMSEDSDEPSAVPGMEMEEVEMSDQISDRNVEQKTSVSTVSKVNKESTKSEELDNSIVDDKKGKDAGALGQIKARSNFNETAFFYPQLTTDKDGVIKIKFTIPINHHRFYRGGKRPVKKSTPGGKFQN